MNLRKTVSSDCESIRNIHLSAFPKEERELVAKLAVDLLLHPTTPPTISFVAEDNGLLIGHVVFSPVTVHGQPDIRAWILAPLSVMPEHHRRGIGSDLVRTGMQQAADTGADICFVYGDPAFYNRFGFTAETAAPYTPPYPLQYPFGWQAAMLGETESNKTEVSISCVSPLHDPALW